MEEIHATMYVELFENPLDLNWSEEGDELMHHVWAALSEVVEMTGHSYQQHPPTDAEPYFYFGYRPRSEFLHSELALVPTTEGIRALVGLTDQSQIPEQVQPWADALIEASKRLNNQNPEYEWQAVIGPSESIRGAVQKLATGFSTRGLTVSPATTPYIDALEARQLPSLSGATLHVSFPLAVRGRARGYDWLTASVIASRELNDLCALLSVAFDAEWRIRQAPQINDLGEQPLPLSRLDPEQFRGMENENWLMESIVAPGWLDEAWVKIASDEPLKTALYAHLQGLRMMEFAPSYALLAFVGVVEGLGSKLTPLRQCDCCDSCPGQIGSGKRFRSALKLVLPAKKVKYLSDVVYSRRSETAHDGRLHGGESDVGAWPIGRVFAPRPTSEEFRYRILWDMHDASRKLLLHFLEATPAIEATSTETTTETSDD